MLRPSYRDARPRARQCRRALGEQRDRPRRRAELRGARCGSSRAATSSCEKFWEGPQAYLIQNDDKRVIFVNPYEEDLCLIGTTDIPYSGSAEDVAIGADEVDYLLEAVNRYFRTQLQAGGHPPQLFRRPPPL